MVELTLGVNLAAQCLTSLVIGSLGDRYGRRPIILLGLYVFIIGSVCCVFANAFWVLIFGRLLQGIGISAPIVLSYLVIADAYSVEKQQQLMGILNGVMTLSMAVAPVIGSYVNLYFGWRGNFSVLLLLSLVCLCLGKILLPRGVPQPEVSLSLKGYRSVVQSKKAIYSILTICFSLQAYWIFIGISPILYMESLGVSLKEFGFYQGALAATLSIGSFASGIFLRRFGQRKCFFTSTLLMAAFTLSLPILVLYDVKNPLIITASMMLLSAGMVLPINILWPLMLESVVNAKGRLAAVQTASRLIITALSIQIASYFYDGTLRSLVITMGIFMVFTFFIGYKLFKVDAIFRNQEKY
jgi:DHA1 family bicyclomycin/chloramphenicol resistance-like MFS transporter